MFDDMGESFSDCSSYNRIDEDRNNEGAGMDDSFDCGVEYGESVYEGQELSEIS